MLLYPTTFYCWKCSNGAQRRPHWLCPHVGHCRIHGDAIVDCHPPFHRSCVHLSVSDSFSCYAWSVNSWCLISDGLRACSVWQGLPWIKSDWLAGIWAIFTANPCQTSSNRTGQVFFTLSLFLPLFDSGVYPWICCTCVSYISAVNVTCHICIIFSEGSCDFSMVDGPFFARILLADLEQL